VPEWQQREEYNPKVPGWVNVYASFHYVLASLALLDLARLSLKMEQVHVWVICGFVVWSMASMGFLLDKNRWCWLSEVLRSSTFILSYQYFGVWSEFFIPAGILNAVFLVSGIISSVMIGAKMMRSLRQEAGAKKIH
jgi:hypothetical protein